MVLRHRVVCLIKRLLVENLVRGRLVTTETYLGGPLRRRISLVLLVIGRSGATSSIAKFATRFNDVILGDVHKRLCCLELAFGAVG